MRPRAARSAVPSPFFPVLLPKSSLRALPMAQKPAEKPLSTFSIDEFIGEIEKAEAETLNKRLPQERLRNKRQLDNAARRAAEKSGTGIQPLVPQPLAKAAKPHPEPVEGRGETPEKPKKEKKVTRSAATGMSLKAPKSKANSVERPDFGGMGESDQAGFGHVPSSGSITARSISRATAKDPEALAQLREALATTVAKAKVPGSSTKKKVALPGQNLEGAQTVGISATVRALEDIILHGRKEVEGNDAWKPHRPAPRQKSEGGIPFQLVTQYEPAGDQPTAIADIVEGVENGETDQVLLGVTGSGKTFTA
eukprot:gene35030-47068_t